MKDSKPHQLDNKDDPRQTGSDEHRDMSSTSQMFAQPLTYRQQLEYWAEVRNSRVFGIERWTMLAVILLRLPMPFLLFSHVFLSRHELRTRKIWTDFYCLLQLVLLILLLYVGHLGSWFLGVLAVWILADIMISVTSGVLLNRPGLYGRPVSTTRSVLLALVNYWEINVGFAVIYLITGTACEGEKNAVVIDAAKLIYFSAITTTTIGYGDVHCAHRLDIISRSRMPLQGCFCSPAL